MKKKSSLARIFMLMLISGTLLQGCKKDPDVLQERALDQELTEALKIAAAGQGLDYYQFPSPQNYIAIPQDPRNPLSWAKVELGKLLYHETALARSPKLTIGMNTYSCASCHSAAAGFQAGLAQGIGEGGMGYGSRGEGRVLNPNYPVDSLDVQPVRSPSALNIAYQECVLWNGQFGATGLNAGTESQWTAGTPKEDNHFGYQGTETQAIAGLKVHRLSIDKDFLSQNVVYRDLFTSAFGNLPDDQLYTREKAGLAIAAYERTLLATQAPFQRWLRGDVNAMGDMEKEGAILFFGKAACYSCHNGPALNSMTFHALGMNDMEGPGFYGTNTAGARDAKLGRGGFTKMPADNYKFKVPQLYNLSQSPFYGHGGTFTSLREVIAYKNAGVPQNPNVPQSQLATEFVPLQLSDAEVDALTAFLEKGLLDPSLDRYEPQSIPSGNCFPNNDGASRVDLGCN